MPNKPKYIGREQNNIVLPNGKYFSQVPGRDENNQQISSYMIVDPQKQDTIYVASNGLQVQEAQNMYKYMQEHPTNRFGSMENAIFTPFNYPNSNVWRKFMYRFNPNWRVPEEVQKSMYKKGGKTLSKSRMNTLKYSGGPGDIDSTKGMNPNKKQRKMLPKKHRFGSKVNGADMITIIGQPDMFEFATFLN